MKIGFIGLGSMGSPMASRLLQAGHKVTVYNRTAERAQTLVAMGASRASQVSDACHGDVVITMLADDGALESLSFGDAGVIRSLGRGAIHVSCSTISVALSKKLTEAHAAKGQQFVSAPVFGRPQAAAEGKLFIAAAGLPDALDTCVPVFEALGQRTFRFGADPWRANLVKLAGNFLIASVIESLSEAMALAGKAGLEQREFLVFLTSTLFSAPVYETYGRLIAEKQFEPAGFTAPLALKDVRLAIAAGEGLHAPLPIASLVHDRLLRLLARGGDSLDWSAISKLAAEDAGLN